jgi:aminoglycoside 3-N-acetyltransferase
VLGNSKGDRAYMDLERDLSTLGLKSGDHVLVRASLNRITQVSAGRGTALVKALTEVVGSTGTVLGLTFTQTFLRPHSRRDYIFDREVPSVTGGFAETLRTWPGAIRSAHPTNSFAAVGGQAAEILHGHGPDKSCFWPLEKLCELDGKMLLVGCLSDSPGFSTVHLAQHMLGLSTRSLFSGLSGVLYRDADGDIKLFRRRDVPGCSRGFDKYYGEYVRSGLLRTGYVGGAYAALISAREAFKLELGLLRANPRSALCRNSDCAFCRGSLFYNKRDWFSFWLRYGSRTAFKLGEHVVKQKR